MFNSLWVNNATGRTIDIKVEDLIDTNNILEDERLVEDDVLTEFAVKRCEEETPNCSEAEIGIGKVKISYKESIQTTWMVFRSIQIVNQEEEVILTSVVIINSTGSTKTVKVNDLFNDDNDDEEESHVMQPSDSKTFIIAAIRDQSKPENMFGKVKVCYENSGQDDICAEVEILFSEQEINLTASETNYQPA